MLFDLECKSHGKDETAQCFLNSLKKTTLLFHIHFFQDFVE